MAAVPYAHVVAKIIGDKHPKGTQIALAPNPKDIVYFIYSILVWPFFDFVLHRFGRICPKPMLNSLINGFLDSSG